MKDRETRRYDAFRRASNFCHTYAADFAETSKCHACTARLNQILRDLDTARTTQASDAPTAKDVLLDALRLDMENILRTADSIDQEEPGFAAQFPPPRHTGQAALLTATDAALAVLQIRPGDDTATQTAKNAKVAKFVAHELPANFVQNLADDRAAITTAQDAEEDSDNAGVRSTAAIGHLIKAGMRELKTLNAIMHNKYTRQPDKLRAWQSASHIDRTAQREKKPDVAVISAPAPAPAQPKVA